MIEIELIDADPDAFGPAERPPRLPRPQRQWRRPWLAPLAFGVAAAVVAGAVFVAWRPWGDPPTIGLRFPTSATPAPSLTERLVLDAPPAELGAASLGSGPQDAGSSLTNLDGAAGHFFAAPGATAGFGQPSSGRWAAFFAVPEARSTAPSVRTSSARITVQGAPGQLTTSVGNRTTDLTFGPVAGMVYSVVTSELTQQETLAFAEAVSVDDDVSAVRDSRALAGLRPVGSIADFVAAVRVVAAAIQPTIGQAGVVSVQYGADDTRLAVTSRGATEKILPMLRFLLGGAGEGATIHGEPALVFAADDGDPLAGSDELGTAIAWVEGDRMVMVNGHDGPEAIRSFAETVRPAADDEWAEVTRVSGAA